MQFMMTREAASRLRLDVDAVCGPDPDQPRVFHGPPIREGLLGGFPRGVVRWLKREMKVERSDQLDLADMRLAYYLLVMRNEDHELCPFAKLDQLALTDFELVKHVVTSFDQDGDCGECSAPLDSRIHIRDDNGDIGAGVPPTTAPASPGTIVTVIS